MKIKILLFILCIVISNEIYSQISDVAFSGGIGICGNVAGDHKIGLIADLCIPLKSSEIRPEVDRFIFPFRSTLKNLSITTLELDYIYRGTIEFRKICNGRDLIFTSVGAGLNYNYINGGCETRHTTVAHPSSNPIQNDSSYSAPIDHKAAFGFALYMGAGIYIFPKISIYWEYTAKAVFYNTNKVNISEEAFEWQGWRLGIRYQPFKKNLNKKNDNTNHLKSL